MNALSHSKKHSTRPYFQNARSRPMPTLPVWPLVLFLVLSLPACGSSWRDSYLNGALKKAPQEEIVEKFGEPWKKKTSLLKHQSRWVYRYALTLEEIDPMGVDTLGRGVSQATASVGAMMGLAANPGNALKPGTRPICFHYVLTFDDETKVLQSWAREACADTAL